METEKAIITRRSIRKFIHKPIEEEKIERLIKDAMEAPSGVNAQPWEFFVIKDKKVQDQFRYASPYANYNSDLIIIVAGNKKRFFQGMEDNGLWIEDCSAATENILLSATDQGLASVWCALFPDPVRMEKAREILKAGEEIVPFAIVHLGYSDIEPAVRSKYDEKKVHII
jgi:nitroreductase